LRPFAVGNSTLEQIPEDILAGVLRDFGMMHPVSDLFQVY
jgi:hypothetical protein